MNTLETDILNAATQAAPSAPAVELTEAAISTAANPSPSNIISDVELVIGLVKQLKTALTGVHPSVANIVKFLF